MHCINMGDISDGKWQVSQSRRFPLDTFNLFLRHLLFLLLLFFLLDVGDGRAGGGGGGGGAATHLKRRRQWLIFAPFTLPVSVASSDLDIQHFKSEL